EPGIASDDVEVGVGLRPLPRARVGLDGLREAGERRVSSPREGLEAREVVEDVRVSGIHGERPLERFDPALRLAALEVRRRLEPSLPRGSLERLAGDTAD